MEITPIRKTSIWRSNFLMDMCCFCCAPRAFITHLDYAIHGMTYTLGIPNSTGGSTKIHHPQKMVAVLDTTNVYTIEISSCISYSWIFFYSQCLDNIQTNRGWKKVQRFMFLNMPTLCTTYCKGYYQYPLEFWKEYEPYF